MYVCISYMVQGELWSERPCRCAALPEHAKTARRVLVIHLTLTPQLGLDPNQTPLPLSVIYNCSCEGYNC